MEDNIHVGRDVAFTNDALNRLIMIEQGTWSGSAITSRTFQELWTLTPTGNWDLYKLDLNGNNTFTDSGDLNDDRTHNKANELTARDTDDNGTDNYTLVHDAAGNLREDGANYKFTYDAFGRLRTVLDANAGDALVAEYWYNGLGYRIAAHQDTDSDGDVDGNDTIVRFIYDERWRVVATYHDSDGSPKSEFIHHNAGLDGHGGGSYIDSVILRDRDASGDPSVMEERVYFCQDWRHDVVAIVSDTGKMLEWVDYTPYGMPYGRPAGDTDSDYDWDATDAGNITGGYDVRKDANLDGVIDANDVTHANSITGGYQTLGRTVLSSTGIRNFTGYAGYVADANLTGKWHVRHRVFDSELGRWLTRDLWGYVDGANLYDYVSSHPMTSTDPLGLITYQQPPLPGPGFDGTGQQIPFPRLTFPQDDFSRLPGAESHRKWCCIMANAKMRATGRGVNAAYVMCCMGQRVLCYDQALLDDQQYDGNPAWTPVIPVPRPGKGTPIRQQIGPALRMALLLHIRQCTLDHEGIHLGHLDCSRRPLWNSCHFQITIPVNIGPDANPWRNDVGGECSECYATSYSIACLARFNCAASSATPQEAQACTLGLKSLIDGYVNAARAWCAKCNRVRWDFTSPFRFGKGGA